MIEIEKERFILKVNGRNKIKEKLLVKEPVEDDDLPQIADEFAAWWKAHIK
jgi:hypothetical protein